MAGESGGEYKDLVVFLAAAGVVVPLFNRFRISPVLGFLAAGVLLGPDGLGRWADQVDGLRAPNRCGGEIFVNAWYKLDVILFEKFFGFPQSFIQTSER